MKKHHVTRTSFLALAMCAGMLASITPAKAQLSANDEMTEAVMTALGSDASNLAQVEGLPETFTDVELSLSVNVGDRSFAYDTLAGQTYLGMSISMQSEGGFDSSTGEYLWTSDITLGGSSFTVDGSEMFTPQSDGSVDLYSQAEITDDLGSGDGLRANGGDAKGGSVTDEKIVPPDTDGNYSKSAKSKGTWTSSKNKKDTHPVWDHTKSTDNGLKPQGDWTMMLLGGDNSINGIVAESSFDASSGLGDARFQAVAVPAPGAIAPWAVGLAGLLARRRRRQ
jgi:hypothetical protein